MKIVTLVGLRGGTGVTTLAVNLAHALSRGNRRPCVVDLDPRNSLALHLNGLPDEPWGHASGEKLGVEEVHFMQERSGAPFPFVPFGSVAASELSLLESGVQDNIEGLIKPLDAFVPADCDLLLLDTPGMHTVWSRAAIQLSHLVLVVAKPCAGSFAALPAWARMLDELDLTDSTQVRFVINDYERGLPLSDDVVRTMRTNLGDAIAPVVMSHDDSVRESLARQKLLFNGAHASRVTDEIGRLADWMGELLLGEPAEKSDTEWVPTAQSAPGGIQSSIKERRSGV